MQSAHQVLGVLGEKSLSLVVRDAGVDDDIVTLFPVNGGGDTVLVAELEG